MARKPYINQLIKLKIKSNHGFHLLLNVDYLYELPFCEDDYIFIGWMTG